VRKIIFLKAIVALFQHTASGYYSRDQSRAGNQRTSAKQPELLSNRHTGFTLRCRSQKLFWEET